MQQSSLSFSLFSRSVRALLLQKIRFTLDFTFFPSFSLSLFFLFLVQPVDIHIFRSTPPELRIVYYFSSRCKFHTSDRAVCVVTLSRDVDLLVFLIFRLLLRPLRARERTDVAQVHPRPIAVGVTQIRIRIVLVW